MEWQSYNRTGRVYAAEFTKKAVVSTTEGPSEAEPGDYLVVDNEATRAWCFSASRFEEAFVPAGRTVPFSTLARLSEIVEQSVTLKPDDAADKKCLRCGKTGPPELFDGGRTCADCDLQIRAEREEARTCHADGSTMEKQVVDHVIIDRCKTCGGVWLDGGEMELLGKMVAKEAGGLPPEVATAFLTALAAT